MSKQVEQLIKETMASYYEYIVNIENGCEAIVSLIQQQDNSKAVAYLEALSEGLKWVLDTERLLIVHSYRIDSPVKQVVLLFENMNAALEQGNMPAVAQILDEAFIPVFKKAGDWRFEKVVS